MDILAFTISITSNFIGLISIIFYILMTLLILFGITYKKCDDWWTTPIALGLGQKCFIIGTIFGLIWLGSKIFI